MSEWGASLAAAIAANGRDTHPVTHGRVRRGVDAELDEAEECLDDAVHHPRALCHELPRTRAVLQPLVQRLIAFLECQLQGVENRSPDSTAAGVHVPRQRTKLIREVFRFKFGALERVDLHRHLQTPGTGVPSGKGQLH